MARPERRRLRTIELAAIVVAAAAARTLFIEWLPGINGDEAWYGVNVQELLSGGTPFWRTGIGNPLSPFHTGPLLVLSALFQPSATMLRVPEVLLGLLAVALAYPLLRRTLGERAAILTALLLAVSPTAVSYARLGWDPSGGPLMTLLAIGFALLDRPWLALMGVAAAWLVHPTNIFIAPIVAAAWAPLAIQRWRTSTVIVRARLLRLGIAITVVGIPVVAWVLSRIAANPNTSLPSISMVIDRVTSPELWAARAWGFVNLLSGVSPVAHIAGPLPPAVERGANLFVAGLTLAVLFAGQAAFRAHRHARWLVAGIAIAFAGFHIVAMDVALTPTAERYGLFMLVPMIITLAVGIDALSSRRPAAGHAATGAVALFMVAMTVGGYFMPLWSRGGDAMTTYRTARTEPKRAAFDFIDADSRAAASVRIVADGWWLYWTLRYFAGAEGRIHVDVVPGSNMPGGTHPVGAAIRPFPSPQRTYWVAFAGGAVPSQDAQSVYTATDPAGRPILHVYLSN